MCVCVYVHIYIKKIIFANEYLGHLIFLYHRNISGVALSILTVIISSGKIAAHYQTKEKLCTLLIDEEQ